MNQPIKTILLISLLSFLPQILTANDMSAGCKSCISGYDCSRINKTCNATCEANLFSKQIDLESCRGGCIGKLEKCLQGAKKDCSYYCKQEEE